MLKRTRADDDFCSTADSFPLFHTADNLSCDTAWAFETEPDPTQMQFSDFGFMNIDIPALQSIPLSDHRIHTNTHADVFAGQDSLAGYQTSNGSSTSELSSRSTSASSALFLLSSSSSSPPFSASVEAQPHTRQANLCRSPCRSETCLTAALRTLTTLHVVHSACLSAHQEDPSVQQAWKMETVLSTNRDVVAGMAPILACSCSGKSLVQLLLSSVCGNLIAWNSAMINALFEQGDSFDSHRSIFSSVSSLSAGHAQAPRARVLPQPITIGQHEISGSLGRALHAQIVAGELRTLEGFVDALSRRFGEASKSDGASSTSPAIHMRNANSRAATCRDTPSLQSKGLSNIVHRHIISSLRTRLHSTRAEIFSRLGQAI
ncbi:hypothetical protein P153DRAFT_50358 [Dothidotthia symphoricarpi CBS 119687]|uniref:Aflatoxin regulatory protein domain-containing protein n=1 Tax=Dothidotthia symphoricarpi CBS 119687 TaxID=1392245 RepID=A0A6A6A8E4_9PLEO|nr:uncharacterized protein P153DRAFT_50358 [Dothidotthia symphoricarpi CBS 119687]KAF2128242.1 hypothetical protein P153DRAFT_50358 [Dothidotthia symphoricarpi CBS 119687]